MADKRADLVILGAGGHARVVADALLLCHAAIAGLIAPAASGAVFGLALLGDDAALAGLKAEGIRRAALGALPDHKPIQ